MALYAADYPDHVHRVVQIGPLAPRTESSTPQEGRGTTPNTADLRYLAELREAGRQMDDPVGYCRERLKLELFPQIMGRPEGLSRTRMDPCLYWNEWDFFRTLNRVIPQDCKRIMGTFCLRQQRTRSTSSASVGCWR